MSGLTFAAVSAANLARVEKWHPGFPDDNEWTGADWSNAMEGEIGELAEALETLLLMNCLTKAGGKVANTVKKLRRHECELRGVGDPSEDEMREALAAEMADVFLYLDLLASYEAVDLAEAIVSKFNRVSERQGFDDRLSAR